MAAKMSGLGKGIDSMIPKSVNKTPTTTVKKEKEEVVDKSEFMVRITYVEPNKEQPRKQFDEDALIELSESIKQFGILQPILTHKKGDYYEIIAGERRWRAAKLAGLKEVPVIVREFTDKEIVEIALIENIQRENLNAIEEAIGFKRLMEEFNMKQDEIAERVSKSRTAVTNSMRLLKLCDKVQQMIIDEMISSGHARTLLAIDDTEQQIYLATRIFDEKLSVREVEKIIKDSKKEKNSTGSISQIEHRFVYENFERNLNQILGTKVNIKHKNNKGKIEIEYYSPEELEHIYELLAKIRN